MPLTKNVSLVAKPRRMATDKLSLLSVALLMAIAAMRLWPSHQRPAFAHALIVVFRLQVSRSRVPQSKTAAASQALPRRSRALKFHGSQHVPTACSTASTYGTIVAKPNMSCGIQ